MNLLLFVPARNMKRQRHSDFDLVRPILFGNTRLMERQGFQIWIARTGQFYLGDFWTSRKTF